MIKNLKKQEFLPVLIFTVIFVASLYLKLIPVLNYNFPFTMDQARDMLDIRHIVELRKPTLIGPTTSINGVFLGPFYYYFNLTPYVISGGDPAALTYWNIAWYMIAGISIFLYFYKKDKHFSIISSSIFLMAPAFFYSSRYFWSANPMPYMTTFYILSFINFLNKTTALNAALVGLIAGLSMQIEAAFAVLFLPFFLLFSGFKRVPLKSSISALSVFGLTLIPQVFFEIRHGFNMTKTFLIEVTGNSQILGDKLELKEVFINHLATFIEFSSGQFEISKAAQTILLLFSVCYLSYRSFHKKLNSISNNLFLLCISFVVMAFAFYMFYSHPLKGWYLLGLRVFYVFIIAVFLSELFKIKGQILKILIILLLVWTFIATFSDQSKFIFKSETDRSSDKSALRNEIEAIDWVYEKARGQGFKAYNYIPSVYDFPYQYLYWWYGTKKYGYQPEVLTYLDDVPEYIKDNDRFFKAKRRTKDSTTFLIYEPDENIKRLHAWLGDFTYLCTIEKHTYPWGTIVELRRPCN